MFWWFNVFSPQFKGPETHWPLSGNVDQDIAPTWWMARSRDGGVIEQRVLREVVSYGRQIGALSDLVLALLEDRAPASLNDKGGQALRQLREWAQQIDRMKRGLAPLPDNLPDAARLLHDLLERYPELSVPPPALPAE
jgi:hypothetical protein